MNKFNSILLATVLSCHTLVSTKNIVELTVFIHGGGLHPAYFSISDFFSVIHEQVDKSLYARTTNLLRHDPFFFQVQPMDYPGLRRAYPIKRIIYGSHIFGAFYDRIYRLTNKTPNKTLYYAFGWEALLQHNARRNASKRLYLELVAKIDQLKRRDYTVYVRIIGYSHGGNVALNLAEQARNYPTSFLSIDELILISTPIHPGIHEFATNKLFKTVYLFYSVGDNVQSTDFLSAPRHTFSRRTLPKQKNCSPYCKITQIQLRIANKTIPTKSTSGRQKNISNYQMINPSHCEMFFFGWTPEWYRKYLTIRPLSVGMLVPIILKHIKNLHLQGHHIRATIIPIKEQIILFDRDTRKSYTMPFLKRKQLHNLQSDLWHYRPKGFNDTVKFKTFYRERMKAALKKVQAERSRQRKIGCVTCKSRTKPHVAPPNAKRLHSA